MIYDVGLTLFLQHIIRSSTHPIHTHLIATLLSQVQLERDGDPITRSTVRECVDILLRLNVTEKEGGKNVYLTDFEPEFLGRSTEFYQLEAVEMLDGGDASLYLRNVCYCRSSALMVVRSKSVWLKKQTVQPITYLHSPIHPSKIS